MTTDKAETRKQEMEEAKRDGTLKEARSAVAGNLENADAPRDGTLKESRAVDDGQSVQPDRSI
ncbi:MAG: hypothetical protein ACJ74J_02735 [Blastocatellia bacterium]